MKRTGRLAMISILATLVAGGWFGLDRVFQLVDDYESDHIETAYYKWGSPPPLTEQFLSSVAGYDYLFFGEETWFGDSFKGAADKFRHRNIDVVFGSYYPTAAGQWMKQPTMNFMACLPRLVQMRGNKGMPAMPWKLSQAERDTLQRLKPFPEAGFTYPGTFAFDWWVTCGPYLARTTEGDTSSRFLANYFVNITLPGAVEATVSCFKRHKRAALGDQELILMIDFESSPMGNFLASQPPAYRAQVHGEMDLDGDGVPHWNDPDEIESLRLAFIHLNEVLVDSMPEIVLTPNGRMPMEDAECAATLNGVFLEDFPMYRFGSLQPNWKGCLDRSKPYSLFNIDHGWFKPWRGRPLILLDGRGSEAVAAISRLFDSTVDTHEGTFAPGGIINIKAQQDLDEPIGPAIEIAPWVFSREFKKGFITVDVNASPVVRLERSE